MARSRWSLSVVSSLALGLGAAVLVLLAGGHPAAAAPVGLGDGKPAPAPQCFARDDSATGTVYSSGSSAAVRQAVAAAVPNDFIRLAGTCAGVAAQAGTTQTVVITQPLTLEGGYSIADWADSFPITQPTTLDAQGLGRVITASADITLSALTVQYGQSFGGNGGGVYAGGNLTLFNPVDFFSNTTQISTTATGVLAPKQDVTGFGGAAYVAENLNAQEKFHPTALHLSAWEYNSAYNAGGPYVVGNFSGQNVQLSHNRSEEYGNAVVLNNATLDGVIFNDNTGYLGGALVLGKGGSIQNSTFMNNNASFATALFFLGLAPATITLRNDVVSGNTATSDGAVIYCVGTGFVLDKMRVENNTVTGAGNLLTFFDFTGSIVNSVFADNLPPDGSEFWVHNTKDLPPPLVMEDMDVTKYVILPHALDEGAHPSASAVVSASSAIFDSGATILITDTIIGGYATDLATDGATTSTISGDYNLFDHTPVISGTNITTGTHSLVGNPLFADALGHLSAGSPAIDHGIDVGINTDLDGNPRPSGGGFDIGAYEFQVALARLFLPLVRR